MRSFESTLLVVVSVATRAGAQVEEPPPADAPPVSWEIPILHDLGLMTTMRLSEAVIWPEPFARTEPRFWVESYERAFTRPPVWDGAQPAFEWDGDAWPINVVGHGLFGSELYMRARTCHHGILPAFAFAVAGSTLWEYGFEGNAVRPSGLDLWFTPVSGVILGEARFIGWREASTWTPSTWRTVVMTVLDPLGEFERALGTRC